MKVLLINKYHYIKGGSETYFFGVKKMLEDNGHTVITFSMKDDKNLESEYAKYFTHNVNYDSKSILDKIYNAINIIYSREAYIKLCRLIRDTKPDIAHVNLIYHQLSPSIFQALKKYNIPTVYTSHDYKIICPNYKCYNNVGVCTRCYGAKYYNCLLYKCHKESYLNSLLVTIEAYLHRLMKSYNTAHRIICPSRFMYNQLLEDGMERSKLICLPNFIADKFFEMKTEGLSFIRERTILYYGRLSKEKGIDLLIEAKKIISPDVKLRIIGTGPEEERLRKRVEDESIPNIEFLGFKQGNELFQEIQSSKCTIIPSLWNEVFGLTVVESYCLGTPVIGSDIAGIHEIIRDGITGFLFKCDDAKDLADKINRLISLQVNEYKNLVQNCLEEKKLYDPKQYYLKLFDIYKETMNKTKNKN